MPALQRSSAGIIRERARRHFVIRAGHLDGLAGLQFVQREIDRAAAIVSRTLRGISDKDLALGRCCVPEKFRYVPGAISVVDQQAVTEGFETKQCAQEGVSRRALEKRASLRVNRRAEEVIGGCVADVEMYAGVE